MLMKNLSFMFIGALKILEKDLSEILANQFIFVFW